MEVFFELGIIIILATLGGLLARLCRQPLIPAYILAGILLGPVFGLIKSSAVLDSLSLFGIAFLLFIVGLELDITKLRDIGKVASLGGIVQVFLTFVLGYFVAQLLGFSHLSAIYLGLILSFSSTMIVVKLLGDKRELNTLHGRIVVGILLMQDIIAIFALSSLATMNGFSPSLFVIALLKAAIVLLIVFLCSKFIFPGLFHRIASSQELLFLGALSICFVFALLVNAIGFSIAIGAFIAGVSLAHLPYNIEIIGKVKSLRDFFATIFFVSLGLNLSFGAMQHLVWPLVFLTLFVLLLKPFIILLHVILFGYAKRTAFLSASSLAQISEFGLILAAQGVAAGHIPQDILTLTVLLAMITITLTSYAIKFDIVLYKRLSGLLDKLGIAAFSKRRFHYLPDEQLHYDVVLVGYDRIGYDILASLKRSRKSFVVVDFNPDIIKQLIAHRIPCIYGDISDEEVLERIDFSKTRLVVSTVPAHDVNTALIHKVKRQGHKTITFVTAESINDAMRLYHAGADYVILPHFLGGERLSSMVEEFDGNLAKVTGLKYRHLDELRQRLAMKHEHPRRH